jgi:hypothetical protein
MQVNGGEKGYQGDKKGATRFCLEARARLGPLRKGRSLTSTIAAVRTGSAVDDLEVFLEIARAGLVCVKMPNIPGRVSELGPG